MKTLLIAQQTNGQLAPTTGNLIVAATAIGGELDLLVVGDSGVSAAAEHARLYPGITRVLSCEAAQYAHGASENLAPLIVELVSRSYSHVMAIASSTGKNLLPRVAALLDVAMVSDVVQVLDADTFVRPIYAASLLAKIRCSDSIRILSVRATAFPGLQVGEEAAPIEPLGATGERGKSKVLSQKLNSSARAEIGTARVIVSGGRGLGSSDAFEQTLAPLADSLGAAIGASRAAVDAGFVSNELQIGQTGKIVAPELYLAVGISGAIQHLAGMKDSKVIVAINKDADAPILQVADYAIVGDLFQIVPDLNRALAEQCH